jgi:hypothetical protein
MDLKALVKAINRQLGQDKAQYITDQIFKVFDTRIVVFDNLVKVDTLTMRTKSIKELLRTLQHESIINISDESINQIIHRYNLLTNPFIKQKKHEQIGSN